MSSSAKHRGWLLVYEAQFWIILALSILATVLSAQNAVVSVLIPVALWGALIWSLYRSTHVVRRVHIVFNWLAALATALGTFSDLPDSPSAAARIGEYTGGFLAVALWVAWALYWHRSQRVKRAYPAAAETQGTADAA